MMLALKSAFHHWRHKRALGDQISMSIFFFGGIFLIWYELIHIPSFYHTEWSLAYTLHLLLFIFLAVNIYGNWLMVFLTDVTGKGMVYPTGSLPHGWHFCDECGANRPPRSHHCRLCRACVLKHDHHCWFPGTCIGYDNHRYFLALCVYITVAAFYGNIYNWSFVWSVKGEYTLLNLLSLIFPLLTVALGHETWYTFCITTLTMFGIALMNIFTWVLVLQVLQILHGQTRYERTQRITKYDRGLWANLEEVLGYRKFLVLLCPWLRSSLPGDGVSFHSHGQKAS
ncbi:probable palmitoyltransferase ZDHHC24 [Littorina saxatilis]|uniref:Palmitoyltransferase n=2 Tax=Littorina saxatilis TaxID=31220 RepID=A0AAN9GB85_9CAEN